MIEYHIVNTIKKFNMLVQGDHLLIGLSGGPDSTCLTHIMSRLKNELQIRISAIYIDHGLRPGETTHEIEFCDNLCKNLNIPFKSAVIDVKTFCKEKGLNIHEAAREMRYTQLQNHAAHINAQKIALGHNADDQAETVLMRILRGTGPAGMSGIPPVRSNIIRPLIGTSRSDIMAELNSRDLDFVVDSSNLKDVYTRNRLRSAVMPALMKINPNLLETISRTIDIFRDEEKYFSIQVTKSLMTLIRTKTAAKIELLLMPMESMHTALLRRLIRRAVDETKSLRGIDYLHIEDIIKLIKKGRSGDRIFLPGGLRIIKGYSTLLLTSELPSVISEYQMTSPSEFLIKEASLMLNAKLITKDDYDTLDMNNKNMACIDAEKIEWPLTIRHRKPGDIFYPLGFGSRKKIQDFFVDAKIPRDERDKIPLIINNSEIVWIAGHRLDDRYKVEKKTTRILKFEIRHII
ncbi:MAG: tRNA lysidine(34) synthetase TilS [Dissulfurispiraceae bacterium]|jgi:tRNA(Ile)-lysidine synthase|nr:tRNA lysidine(34) synthetase TilS [Dissulfurispiraceae bacterium]